MTKEESKTAKRDTYRHGDLYQALLQAGVELARHAGPEAVVLREVTRRVGVVPNAAYRHFADRAALLNAVCDRAQAALAITIEAEIAAIKRAKEHPALYARSVLRAVGTGYLGFAQAEPGLFRTAFSVPAGLETAASATKAGNSGRSPFQLLSGALDLMAEAGILPPERRFGAEFLAWSAVHGLAMLVIDGPLRSLDATQKNAISQRLLDMVENGLT
ncbi:TetR/AcrR family transcriptional regulator [Noviherbaspirillum sp. CPCC 100848]|uniref:TetR/AcrR family transcriptional regulator n=1 Tax=Noviherbaspirillum album TaxID=3080276 RepID=A0ABU6J1S8_9BURK|nr:TetR/AcrR family transcriptional regulator [Noviherbaspirillum sp. CPCC 100848]MEC4717578.1 TetR/AcrR family transcriptional regulator [Noviherbaspirillum sp. CPCC 100848]